MSLSVRDIAFYATALLAFPLVMTLTPWPRPMTHPTARRRSSTAAERAGAERH